MTEKNSAIEYVIEAINTGKSVIDIYIELRGKRISAEEKWYIDGILRNYETDRIVAKIDSSAREQRESFKEVTNHLTDLEKSVEKYYSKIEGLIQGLLLGGYRGKRKGKNRK